MAITFVDYTATASQTEFLFNFDYLEDEHVAVFVDGVKKTIGADQDYTVVTSPSKRIVLNAAATGGEIVRVRRISAPEADLVDFQNGSVLTESELDRAYLHNRYLAEESAEQNDISLRVKAGSDGSFDALNKKIVNVVDPTADQDAATKNYVDDTVAGVVGGSIPDGSVTYAKIQNSVGNNVLLGNDNGADSDVQELTATEVRTLLNVADGATANTGTVVSIASGTGLAGGPITTSGTLSLASIANLRALGNVSGAIAAPVAIDIKDEDAMTSNSNTSLATQQSIKAYIDNRIASSTTILTHDTGWFNDTIGLTNNTTYAFTHTLNSTRLVFQIYVADDDSGTNAVALDVQWDAQGTTNDTWGAIVNSITTTGFSVNLGNSYLSSIGSAVSVSFVGQYIRVIAVGF